MGILERKVSCCLRRCLGLARSLSTKFQLRLKSLEEEFKITQTKELLMYRDSRDPKVTQTRMVIKACGVKGRIESKNWTEKKERTTSSWGQGKILNPKRHMNT